MFLEGMRLYSKRFISQSLGRILNRRRKFAQLPEGNPISTARTLPCSPALYEFEQLSRVKKCGFRSTLEREVEKLNAREFQENPMQQIILNDALVVGQHIMTRSSRYAFGFNSRSPTLNAKFEKFDKALLVNSLQGMSFFGHWLRDDCAVYENLRGGPQILSLARPDWPDCAIYEELFQQDWQEITFARIHNLKIYRDLGFSQDKGRRLRLLRERVARRLDPLSSKGDVVFIARGQSGAARQIKNFDDLTKQLTSQGVEFVSAESGSTEMLRKLAGAKLAISVEGSQISHALFTLPDTGALLVIQPPERFYNPHHEWARLLGMRYGIVIGDAAANSSFLVNTKEVLTMAERLLAAPAGIMADKV